MRSLRANTRPLVRLLTTLVTVAMMWLPATAHAQESGADPAASTTTTVLPLLGSNLTVEIITDATGVVTSVNVDGATVDFEQEDDEISFLYTTADGQTFTIEVEFGDDDIDDDSDDHDDEGDLDDDSDDLDDDSDEDSDEDSDDDSDDDDDDDEEDSDDDEDDSDEDEDESEEDDK